MMDALKVALVTSVSALQAQSMRLRVVSENLANASSTGATAGSDPYARKTIAFKEELDRASNAATVRVAAIGTDRTPFRMEHDPGNPAADKDGNVKMPNVNPLLELAYMREAHRSYEASLQVVRQARDMTSDLIDLLKNR